MAFEFRLPDIGEGIHEGEIVQWLVNVGDTVREDQPILEVMTDKVTAEIPTPVSGVVQELRGKPGEVIKVGSVVVVIDESGATAAPVSKQEQAVSAKTKNECALAASPATAGSVADSSSASAGTNGKSNGVYVGESVRSSGKVLAAPATRKLARQLGVDLALVSGSGPRGRITQSDVQSFRPGAAPVAAKPAGDNRPLVPHSAAQSASMGAGGKVAITASQGDQRKPFAGMRRKIAEHLVKSKLTAPHFGYVEEVDMTELLATRNQLKAAAEAQGVKLTFLPFIIKAVIAGLKAFPVLNSQLDETTQELVYKGDYNIGIAVATEDGLVVPVIKHADQKNLIQLAAEIKDLSDKARVGKLSLDEIKGGTFTITSIGSIGGLFGIPIINYPEVGIMGVNKISQRPVVRDGQIVIRDMMYLSLSCDHRVVDGAEGAQFINVVIDYLQTPAKLLLI